MKKKLKYSIRQLKDKDWRGYHGNRLIATFGASQKDAKEWLRDMMHPKQDYGYTIHPETGHIAPPDQMWVQSLMGPWVLQSDRLPYTLSVASETYWSS